MNRFMVEPSPFKRIASYFIDLVLTIAIGFVLFATLGQNVIAPALGADEASKDASDFAVASGLAYYPDDGGAPLIYEYKAKDNKDGKKGYEAYLDHVWYYYTEFLNVAKNPNDKVVGRKTSDGKDFASEDYYRFFFEKRMGFAGDSSNSNPYFDYAREGDNILLASKPVLNAEYQAKVDANDEDALNLLLKYFFNADEAKQTGLYFDAIKDMKGTSYSGLSVQTYYQDKETRYSWAEWGSEIICLAPITLIVFLLVPLCLKGGQSVGKLLLGLEVTDAEGFRINKLQRIFRPLLVSLLHLCALIPHVGLGLGIYFVVAIVSFLMMALGKRRMNIHERITRTIVVDKKRSIIFDSLHDKSLYMEKHNLDERGNPLVKVSLVEGEPNVNLTKEE